MRVDRTNRRFTVVTYDPITEDGDLPHFPTSDFVGGVALHAFGEWDNAELQAEGSNDGDDWQPMGAVVDGDGIVQYDAPLPKFMRLSVAEEGADTDVSAIFVGPNLR